MERFIKIDTPVMPLTDGYYTTNFGLLEFRDGSFWCVLGRKNGGVKKVKIAIEWWMEELVFDK
jgi:hypothetical protein